MNLTTDKCVFLDAKWWEFLGGDICRNVDGENIRTYAMCFDSACPKIAQKGIRAKDSSFSSQSTDISHIWAVFRKLAQGMFWNLVFALKCMISPALSDSESERLWFGPQEIEYAV